METQNILCQNFPFFRRMRNFYYEKAWKLFQDLESGIKTGTTESTITMLDVLNHYLEALDIAHHPEGGLV